MDPSAGQFNWKTGGKEEGVGKKKKPHKKPHWLVAKEAGKKKNGSEKRREKRLKEEKEGDGEEKQEKTKLRKVDREIASGIARKSPEEQCDYVWGEVNDVTQEKKPDIESFVGSELKGDRSFGDHVQSIVGEDWKEVCQRKQKKKKQKNNGAKILVVSPGAVRCVELINDLRAKMDDNAAPIAKLFSKHMKIEEQQSYLKNNYVGVGVGTPNRIFKLIEEKHLSLKHTKLIVIDCKPNPKGQTIFNLNDTRNDLLALLSASFLKAMRKHNVKLALL